jgi:hypothetical protein
LSPERQFINKKYVAETWTEDNSLAVHGHHFLRYFTRKEFNNQRKILFEENGTFCEDVDFCSVLTFMDLHREKSKQTSQQNRNMKNPEHISLLGLNRQGCNMYLP